MPVAVYNLKPPQVQAIQIATHQATIQLIASFLGGNFTSLAQLRAAMGPNDQGQQAQIGDWLVHPVGGIGHSVLTNATFNSQYVLAT